MLHYLVTINYCWGLVGLSAFLGRRIIFILPTKWSGIWILIKDIAAGNVISPEILERISIADLQKTAVDHATNTIEPQFQNGITTLILKAELLTMRFLRAYCRQSVHLWK